MDSKGIDTVIDKEQRGVHLTKYLWSTRSKLKEQNLSPGISDSGDGTKVIRSFLEVAVVCLANASHSHGSLFLLSVFL